MKTNRILYAVLTAIIALFVILPGAARADNTTLLADAIIEWNTEIGGGLTVTSTDNTVTVTGTAGSEENPVDVEESLELEIDDDVTVIWDATLIASGDMNLVLIDISGKEESVGPRGTFKVISGDIKLVSSESSRVINATGVIIDISGGEVRAEGENGTAINANYGATVTVSAGSVIAEGDGMEATAISANDGSSVTVSGGTVSVEGENSTAISAGDSTVTVSGGTVSTLGGSGEMGAAISATSDSSVTVSGGEVIAGENGRAISAASSFSTVVTVTVNGGTVSAQAGRAIWANNYYGEKVIVNITSGDVSATTGTAIVAYNGSEVTVSGGTVTATWSLAIEADEHSEIIVSGGLVLAYGEDVDEVIEAEDCDLTDNGLVVAWNEDENEPGEKKYFAGTSEDLKMDAAVPTATVEWAIIGGKKGISYYNGLNTGFHELNVAINNSAISIPAIGGVTAPAGGETPVTTIIETSQYTGTVAWEPTIPTGGSFGYDTIYTATITLTAKDGYTLIDVGADFFTVAGATSVNYNAGSNVITAKFPATPSRVNARTPDITVQPQNTTYVQYAEAPPLEVTASVTDSGTLTYQWYSNTSDRYAGSKLIEDETEKTYMPPTEVVGDLYYYVEVTNTKSGVSGDPIAKLNSNIAKVTVLEPDITINDPTIVGVTPPVARARGVIGIQQTEQYIGTVTWKKVEDSSDNNTAAEAQADDSLDNGTATAAEADDDPFEYDTIYEAIITLTAKAGYTLKGVAADFFEVAHATSVANAADSGVITAVFPRTGSENDTIINIIDIRGVTPPVAGAAPVTTITETAQYTGEIRWTPAHRPFGYNTIYTATITLTPKPGYTLTGVTANSFTVARAATVTNEANSGVIKAVFPKTGLEDCSGGGGCNAGTGVLGLLALMGSALMFPGKKRV